uniref:CCHC-type domain-containing protein n=1 Tax=Glossina brevipalpis TaxID=37001 RepID=A0A1A9WGD7_9MUSC
MILLAERYEDIPPERPTANIQRPHTATLPTISEPISNQRSSCHRCGQDGHYANACTNPQILFCWDCGRQNIRTKDCCRRELTIQARGMSAAHGSESSDDDEMMERPKPAAVLLECKNLVATVNVGGLQLTGMIDTGATKSIIKSHLTNFIPYILSTQQIITRVRMAVHTNQQWRIDCKRRNWQQEL